MIKIKETGSLRERKESYEVSWFRICSM